MSGRPHTEPFVLLAVALILSASMWFYVQRVFIPHQVVEATATGRPRGLLSDLYPRWLGARELLLNGRDPYSREVTNEIQKGYYGRSLDPSRPDDPKDQAAFVYPAYVVFLLAPTVTTSFDTVRVVFSWLLVVVSVLSVALWLYVVGWRLQCVHAATTAILFLGTFQFIQGLKLQQLSLMVAPMLAAATALAACGFLSLSGFLLALAMVKPQLTLPLLAWLVIWTIGHWRSRWRLAVAFAVTMLALTVAAEFVLPGWIGKFRMAIQEYREYTGGAPSLLQLLTWPTVGSVMNAGLILITAMVCWRSRGAKPGSDEFAFVTSFVLAATVIIIPMVALYNQVLLLPSVLILIRKRRQFLGQGPLTRIVAGVTVLIAAWPWAAALGISVAATVMSKELLLKTWWLPLHGTVLFPVLLTATLLCVLRGANLGSVESQ